MIFCLFYAININDKHTFFSYFLLDLAIIQLCALFLSLSPSGCTYLLPAALAFSISLICFQSTVHRVSSVHCPARVNLLSMTISAAARILRVSLTAKTLCNSQFTMIVNCNYTPLFPTPLSLSFYHLSCCQVPIGNFTLQIEQQQKKLSL